MTLATRAALFRIKSEKEAAQRAEPPAVGSLSKGKIVLQPRVCTLRAFGEDRGGVIKAKTDENYQVSRFFETLSDYIESSRKSQDFEIITGRLAMIVFAWTVSTEIETGSSVFKKMDLRGIAEAGGVCAAAVAGAATFAWFSSNRKRVGRFFTLSCNSIIDSLIDQIVDGLFYE
ncbi:stress enhanced protein 2, partial [Genlisea aurea]